jgi:cytochrome c biogenesis protein ResB
MVHLNEGQQTDKILLRGAASGEEPLGATIRCEDFDTGFFPHTQIVSHFISTISVLKNDRAVMTGPVEVNRSFIVNGWELHQTYYEKNESENRYELTLKPEGSSTTITLRLSSGQRRAIPGLEQSEIALSQTSPLTWTIFKAGQKTAHGRLATSSGGDSMRLVAQQFEPDFVMGENHTITSRSGELNNPALKVSLYRGLELLGSQWLFGREELKGMMHHADIPYQFDLAKIMGQAPNWRFQVLVQHDKAVIGTFDLALGREASFASADHSGHGSTPPADAKSYSARQEGAGGWTVRLIRNVPSYATIITLTRNPMIPMIYFGCAVMLLGLMVAFFIRRREIWFWVDAAEQRLHLAAVYRYAQPEPDRATLAVIESLKEGNERTARIKVNKEQVSS